MIRLPSGVYFIGDPCYAVADRDWAEYLETEGGPLNAKGERSGIFTFKGKTCFWANTAYGDGNYDGFCVDAGLLGLTPIEVCEPIYANGIAQLLRLGKLEHLTQPTVEERDGMITLGKYRVDTGDEIDILEEDSDG